MAKPKTIDLYLDKTPTKFRVMTPEEVNNELPATLYVRSKDNERALRCRRNGKLKTWKRTPGRFELPIAYGLYEHWRMTETDVAQGRLLALVPPRVPDNVYFPVYYTYRNGAGVEACLRNGSFLRVTMKEVQVFMNGDFMETLPPPSGEGPEEAVDLVKYMPVDRELAERFLPKICGGRGE